MPRHACSLPRKRNQYQRSGFGNNIHTSTSSRKKSPSRAIMHLPWRVRSLPPERNQQQRIRFCNKHTHKLTKQPL